MNCLFYCQGDNGDMLDAFKAAFSTQQADLTIINANDSASVYDPASIDAAIVWQPPANFFHGLSNLSHVFALAAGVDQLLSHPGLPKQATVIRLQDAGMAKQMEEYVLYGVIRAQRGFHEFDVAQRNAQWAHGRPVQTAINTHVGILGAGVLAQAVAQRLVLNGYKTSCWSRTKKDLPAGVASAHGADALPDFVAQSHVLVCLLALTDQTRGIVNMSLMKHMPNGGFIINCARGEHVVDVDLLNAIDEGLISGAMLDVFHHEPLPENHPFWTHPRILVTPHEAARSLVEESVAQTLHSITQVLRDETPDGTVDRSLGY